MELSKSKFSTYSSLASAKMRRKHGLFAVEGEKSVEDTIDAFSIEALICESGHVPPYATGRPVYEVSSDTMRRLSSLSTPPRVIAIYRLPEPTDPDNLPIEKRLYMVLDGVQDPGNLGTIVRTCHWFGIYTIFASMNTVDIFNPKCVQSTMGSIARVRVVYCDLERLFKNNPVMPVYGTLLEGMDIYRAELGDKGFIVMGNEGKGISPELRKSITNPLFIPPANADHGESLNVAIAAAVTLSQFAARRG